MKTITNTTAKALGIFGMLCSSACAGSVVDGLSSARPESAAGGFDRAIRPMTNPTLFDLALPTTNIHPIFLHHAMPDRIGLAGGGTAPLGGDAQLYALQFEIALNERLSIVATKDGYADMDFDNTLTDSSGFANLGGGLKYAFHLDPVAQTALSGSMTFEFPTGNSDIFQGEGKGLSNIILSGVKLVDDWQFAAGTGLQVPFSNEQSTMGWLSTHISYEVTPWFIPLVELNWFTVLDEGDGTGNFGGQLGGGVPGAVGFEGGDLFNLGATNGSDNGNFVSAALGFRSRLSDSVTAGVAYEVPLTDDQDSLMESRLTMDVIWKF